MVENLDTKVPIQENLKKELIFGINARLPIALVAGLSGYRDEILTVMQTLSHSSRAFTVNADGFKGFLVEEVPSKKQINMVKDHANCTYEEAKKALKENDCDMVRATMSLVC